MQIDSEGDLWVLANTLPRFIYGKLNTNEYNFRIFRTNVNDAIRGTLCDLRHHDHGFGHKWEYDDDDHPTWDLRDDHEHKRGPDDNINWERDENWKGGFYGSRNGYGRN